LSRVEQIRELAGAEFELYTGEDANTVDFILAGGQGVISVTANVAPASMHLMCQAALAGDAKKAKEINQTLQDLHQNLFVESNPIPVKWALAEMGMIPTGIRLPMTVLSEQHHQSVRQALVKAGVLN
jgi:4-hydroxy-tetrahydrodipicolinate synthase